MDELSEAPPARADAHKMRKVDDRWKPPASITRALARQLVQEGGRQESVCETLRISSKTVVALRDEAEAA